MQSRIDSPAQTVRGAFQALMKLGNATRHAGVPATTHYLLQLRASQINGCSICVDMHSRELKAAGEPDTRINTVAAWRETPYFTDAERAALALTEAVTRLADRPDPVPDEVWDEALDTTTTPSSPPSCSRSRRSTPGIGSTPRPGRSPASGSSR
jgi:AhpD family alkylhydroperoxidase